jgi:hypothetical protein
MKILPPVTTPWRKRISRRHTPKQYRGKKAYRSYVPCLRWEFGFSCAFCLCHEADLAAYGAKGSGVLQVEHFFLQSAQPGLRSSYENCFYICRFCNEARGAAPITDIHERQLINPCDRAWGEAFSVRRDRFVLHQPEDGDAAYTRESYELNDPRKTTSRKLRRLTIGKRLRFLARTQELEDKLLDRIEQGRGTVEDVDTAWAIFTSRRNAFEDLKRFRAVPEDSDRPCACTSNPQLSPALAGQTLKMPSVSRRRWPTRKHPNRSA